MTTFWIDEILGHDDNDGLGPGSEHALATRQSAIDKCTGIPGDVVFLMPMTDSTEERAADE